MDRSLTRIHGAGYREAIDKALAICGPVERRLGHVQFVTGVDPRFIGLHHCPDGKWADGTPFSYSEVTQCVYPWNIDGPADRRVTTVVVPPRPWHVRYPWALVSDIVHELGHALHPQVGFKVHPVPVSEYAKTNRYEAFAEAFLSWRWGPPSRMHWPDPATLALFRSL